MSGFRSAPYKANMGVKVSAAAAIFVVMIIPVTALALSPDIAN
jgi:hypothetical protein